MFIGSKSVQAGKFEWFTSLLKPVCPVSFDHCISLSSTLLCQGLKPGSNITDEDASRDICD